MLKHERRQAHGNFKIKIVNIHFPPEIRGNHPGVGFRLMLVNNESLMTLQEVFSSASAYFHHFPPNVIE